MFKTTMRLELITPKPLTPSQLNQVEKLIKGPLDNMQGKLSDYELELVLANTRQHTRGHDPIRLAEDNTVILEVKDLGAIVIGRVGNIGDAKRFAVRFIENKAHILINCNGQEVEYNCLKLSPNWNS